MSKKHVGHAWGSGYNILQGADNKYLSIVLENGKLDKEQVESLIDDLKDFVKTMEDTTTFEKDKNGKTVIKKNGKTIAMQG